MNLLRIHIKDDVDVFRGFRPSGEQDASPADTLLKKVGDNVDIIMDRIYKTLPSGPTSSGTGSAAAAPADTVCVCLCPCVETDGGFGLGGVGGVGAGGLTWKYA